jgi:hypothetical protein
MRLGSKVYSGSYIRTGGNSKVKVVYKNGDQMMVGPGTIYQIKGVKLSNGKTTSTMKLMYGTVRAVIDKDGPRNNMKIKTKTAAMGVRGTDFKIYQGGAKTKTKLVVLRGEVEVKVKKVPKKEIIKAGTTMETTQKNDITNKPEVIVKPVTKVDLISIQKETKIEKSEEEVSQAVKVEIEKAQKKAAEVTVKDIKRYNANSVAKLDQSKIDNPEALNSVAVKSLIKDAPVGRKGKIDLDTFNDLQSNAYDKYFDLDE